MNLEKIVRFGNQYFQEQTDGTFAEIERQSIVDVHGHSGPTLVKVVDQLPLVADKPKKEVSAKTENETKFTTAELRKMKRPELNEIAKSVGLVPEDFTNNMKLISAIVNAQKS